MEYKIKSVYFIINILLLNIMLINCNVLYPNNKLVAEWFFNNDAIDSSKYKNHGTIYGPIITTNRSGNLNSAYYFDGYDDYIYCGYKHVLA